MLYSVRIARKEIRSDVRSPFSDNVFGSLDACILCRRVIAATFEGVRHANCRREFRRVSGTFNTCRPTKSDSENPSGFGKNPKYAKTTIPFVVDFIPVICANRKNKISRCLIFGKLPTKTRERCWKVRFRSFYRVAQKIVETDRKCPNSCVPRVLLLTGKENRRLRSTRPRKFHRSDSRQREPFSTGS